MNAAMSKAVKRNWARASKLAELAGITAFQARNYLATRATDEDKTLLDNGADRRNKAVRNLIQEAQAHFGVLTKADHIGVADKSIPEAYRSSCGGAYAQKAEPAKKEPARENICEKVDVIVPVPTPVPVELLFDLRTLVTRYGEAEVVAGLSTYLYLQNRNN